MDYARYSRLLSRLYQSPLWWVTWHRADQYQIMDRWHAVIYRQEWTQCQEPSRISSDPVTAPAPPA